MNCSTFKMYREEDEKVILDLAVKREDNKFSITEKVNGINKNNLTLDQLNNAFQKIGLSASEQDQLITEINGETVEVEVNDDIMDEFRDFFDFMGELSHNVKELEEK